jgi:CRP-like cAMP-binding protein
MQERLKLLIRHIVDIEDRQLDKVIAEFKPISVKQGELLLSSGETCSKFYYVNTGCLRTYFMTKDGHEKTRLVLPAPSIGTSLASFISQSPSFEFIDALENSETMVINYPDFYRLIEEVPEWRTFYIKILEMAYIYQNRRIENLSTLSARQRYEKLLEENPSLVQKLSNKILASYLDITQETLSRLKSKRFF